MLPCQYKQLLGIDCPICGLQRSIIAILKGDFYESFILFPGLICSCMAIVFFALYKIFTKQVLLYTFIALCICDLIVIMINWIYKLI